MNRFSLLVATGISTFAFAFAVGCGAPADGGGASTDHNAGSDAPDDQALQSEGDGDDDGVDIDGVELDGDAPLVAADDSVPAVELDPELETLSASGILRTTANLNLRTGPSTGYRILKVIPKGATVTRLAGPTYGWYKVGFHGTDGWSSGTYLRRVPRPSPSENVNGPASRDNAIARARTSVGFSYWWGGGAWSSSGATSSTRGSCSGSCPSCSHYGRYGADCSGMVAKAWQFGDKALGTNSHPYRTANFIHDYAGKWRTVSRSSLKPGDALVYNQNGSGHIVLYEKGSGWGSPTVYECKGCSYGCVHDTRSFSSSYHGIRRAGF